MVSCALMSVYVCETERDKERGGGESVCEPLLPPVVERQKMRTEMALDCTACPPVHYSHTHTHRYQTHK